MKKHYFTIIIRNIFKDRGYTLLKIFGLSLGICIVISIYLWVFDGLSFDQYHENVNQIYRIEQDYFSDGIAFHVNVTPYPSGPVWLTEIPEIEKIVRFAKIRSSLLMNYENKKFYEEGITAVDSTIFPILKQAISVALKNPIISLKHS